ncbi:3-deoxy-manno-octulosonate cytidylyltransferase [Marinobacter caseinilyticus]|uniref:3-deoxy-manno-octulosonate cytidylyltransferase n=1 Tax=Marinobacter caseinilyticus TaxID=2692195 RepID=UPI001408728D|nr:3-deoxy-manno-octulosonate cytidylyltransferase [Marinobacter caseinilyticus]
MSFTVVIPARYASTRLPGKPLADIGGKPMVQHVCERAAMSQASRVVVATDDDRIRQVCEGFGAEVVMTSANHVSGTDRLEEVVRKLGFDADARIVNVQGDEPLIPPSLIDQVAANLQAHPDAAIATLCESITDADTLFNPNVVKVVFGFQGMAHYFSRAPIPWARNEWASIDRQYSMPEGVSYYRHIGIYGYRVGLLKDFVTWQPAPAELAESLEQLRALHNGARIHVDIACEKPPAGVDTEADLHRLRAQIPG